LLFDILICFARLGATETVTEWAHEKTLAMLHWDYCQGDQSGPGYFDILISNLFSASICAKNAVVENR
jgi:hypothetical protein